jgi:hypothetical protein
LRCAGNSVTLGPLGVAFGELPGPVWPAILPARRSDAIHVVSCAGEEWDFYTKKVRVACWKAAIGQWASGKAA